MAAGGAGGKMPRMNRMAATSIVSSPRRFILLPEVAADGGREGPRVRRYRLTSVGLGTGRQRVGLPRADIATARTARDLGPLGRLS